MADRHQAIQDAVKIEWTKTKRGRLYNSAQGLAIPYADFQIGIYIPKWFGPLKRKFRGFPDTFGFEYKTYNYYENFQYKEIRVPVFCTVEIKTRNDNLSVHQKRVMGFLVSTGALCYVAKENKDDDNYTLKRWVG